MSRVFVRVFAGLALLIAAMSPAFAQKPAGKGIPIVLLSPADDPRLDKTRLERSYLGQAGGSAADGLAMALEDASFELDAAKLSLEVLTLRISSNDDLRAQLSKIPANAALIVSELPIDQLRLASDIAAKAKLVVLNVSDAQDTLREAQCAANLFHLVPSERMLADALGQTLLSRKWSKVLLLHGESADDKRRAELAERAIKRYGLKLAAKKTYKLSADPRERERANLNLLASGVDFDVAWVVDTEGEFARGVPYRLPLPRPVVGDAGLVALAWEPRFERFGAPQPSKAFAKAYKRPMTGQDWVAWMAGKAAVQAVLANQGKKSDLAKVLAATSFKLDGSKGQAMSFRPWDRQLRQPILLSDGQGVIGLAPVEGVMHPSNALDTLGADGPEKLCKAPS